MLRIKEGAVPSGGHYAAAVIAHGFVFVSGQGPVDPAGGRAPDGFAAQVRQTLANVRTVLAKAGASMQDVVKVNVYLADVTRFAEYDAVYREFFPTDAPARTTVGAQLVAVQVEIDCVAALAG